MTVVPIYSLDISIQSQYGKIQNKNFAFAHFSYSV